jgi:type VII secretion-associated serine protease mycosin
MIRRGLTATAAVILAALPLFPAQPAGATAVPRPRSDQWWFPAWDIENKLWPLSKGAGVTVAVVDTGVNANLPGLRDAVIPGTDLDSGNGDGRTDTDAESGGHGTAMAELIAGQGLDQGMVGVAPEARILPVAAAHYLRNIPDGIKYAADHGAKVINVSQAAADSPIGGHLCPGNVAEAIAYALRKDAVIVAAAGNDGDQRNDAKWPADCPGVLAVGAINGQKIPWTKTERQPYVSIAAPGIEIGSVRKNGRFTKASGTSDAAALVSGAVALIRSKDPNLSAREVVQRMINTAIDAGPPGHDVYTGAGVMIPYRAMTADVAKNAPNPPYEALDKYLASHKQAPIGQPNAQSGKPSAAKKSSSSGLLTVILIGAVVLVAAAVVVFLVIRRRGGGSGPVVQEQPFSNAPYGQYPPAPPQSGPYATHDGAAGPPSGHPQGQRPSFRPPADPGGPPQ